MKITVHFFARAKELAGADTVAIDLPDNATVGDLRRVLPLAHPSLAALANRCAVAVDNEFADDSHPLSPKAEVALLPPVSGG